MRKLHNFLDIVIWILFWILTLKGMGHLKDVKIVHLIIKPEMLRGSHFFLLRKAIKYQTKQTCPRTNGTYIYIYTSSDSEIHHDRDIYICHNFNFRIRGYCLDSFENFATITH